MIKRSNEFFNKLINLPFYIDVFVFGCACFKELPLILLLPLLSQVYLSLFLDFLIDDEFPDHINDRKSNVADIFIIQVAGYLIQIVVEFADLLVYSIVNLNISLLFDFFPRHYCRLYDFKYVLEKNF